MLGLFRVSKRAASRMGTYECLTFLLHDIDGDGQSKATTFMRKVIIILGFALSLWSCVAHAANAPRPTNVVLIMTDNQGAWTLGCYGNPDVRSPNIDRLAAEGARFTRAFSSNAVCSPTRATYLTGLIPSQHGVHCFLSAGEPQVGLNAYCTISEFRTLPRILSESGYACGLSGKWHLGANLTPQEGFREWITMPHGATRTFHNADVIEEGKIRKEPKYLTELWTEHGVRFIENHRDEPFFLFLSYNGPYGLGPSLLEPGEERYTRLYADQPLPSFPRETMHPWLHDNKAYLNNPAAIRRYAAEVTAIDDGVGQILQTLQRLKLDEQTLVVLCADQGWLGGQHGIWGMGDHTRPFGAFDGMMQVPLLFRQPGRIPAGKTIDQLVSNYDFMPSLLAYLGLGDKTPQKPRSPGRNYAPLLTGEPIEWNNEVFYEMENVRAVRTGEWKYVHRHRDGPDELYDLVNDPGELKNLHGEMAQLDQERQLVRRLDEFFNQFADPKYDLYRGGRSKSKLLTERKE
jgi:arylsulfatase A-like enzyme